MAEVIGSDQWWERLKRERAEKQQRRSSDFFESGDAIPDLDLMPPCSICDGGLSYDEGFYCEVCNVQWHRNGTEGERLCMCITKGGVLDRSDCFHREQATR